MIQKIKRKLLIVSAALMLLVPTVGVPAIAAADCTGVAKSVQSGINQSLPNSGAVSCEPGGADDTAITNLAKKIINTFSIIVGAASVIMIIYGGFRYITSGGESGRVGAAKNSLLYAIVGLVIVALAQLIIHFVLSQAAQIT